MNERGAWTQTLTSRWSSALLGAVAVAVVAVSAAIVVSGRGAWVLTTRTIRAGSPVRCGPATPVTGGLGRGWPGSVLARARGPPSRGVGGRCRVPCRRVIYGDVREVRETGRGRSGTGCRRDLEFRSKFGWCDATPAGSDSGGLSMPADEEPNDEVKRSARRGRQPCAAGGSRAHDEL